MKAQVKNFIWLQIKKYPKTSAVIGGFLLLIALASVTPSSRNQLSNDISNLPTDSNNKTLHQKKVLTTEQAEKVLQDEKIGLDCTMSAVAGEPGTENEIWSENTQTPVIQAYKEKGQQVTSENEDALYELVRIATYKTKIEKMPKQEAIDYLQGSYLPDYNRIHRDIGYKTTEFAVEIGAEIYYPALLERVKIKCAHLYQG